jgi:hypothetical protein
MRALRGRAYAFSRPIQRCARSRSTSVSAFILRYRSRTNVVYVAHPGNTIDPITLQKWGKKLKSYYGWSEEVLLQHANEV